MSDEELERMVNRFEEKLKVRKMVETGRIVLIGQGDDEVVFHFIRVDEIECVEFDEDEVKDELLN